MAFALRRSAVPERGSKRPGTNVDQGPAHQGTGDGMVIQEPSCGGTDAPTAIRPTPYHVPGTPSSPCTRNTPSCPVIKPAPSWTQSHSHERTATGSSSGRQLFGRRPRMGCKESPAPLSTTPCGDEVMPNTDSGDVTKCPIDSHLGVGPPPKTREPVRVGEKGLCPATRRRGQPEL